jgi:hypothetical protein
MRAVPWNDKPPEEDGILPRSPHPVSLPDLNLSDPWDFSLHDTSRTPLFFQKRPPKPSISTGINSRMGKLLASIA